MFGVCKSLVNCNEGWKESIKSGMQTLVIGGLAAGSAFGVVRVLDRIQG